MQDLIPFFKKLSTSNEETFPEFNGELILITYSPEERSILRYAGNMEVEVRTTSKTPIYYVCSKENPSKFGVLLEDVQAWSLESRGRT